MENVDYGGTNPVPAIVPKKTKRFIKLFNKYYMFYLFILPGIVLLFVFAYIPMYGVQIAFRDYKFNLGFFNSPWVGLKHFAFLGDSYIWKSVKNTILIAVYRELVTWPAPILIALMLNEVNNSRIKRLVQTFSYLPHFISWIVVAFMIYSLTALESGSVNIALQGLGLQQINFMGEAKYFRHIVVLSSLWKETGWGTIIYLAALSNIDQEVYEAAIVDGAGRLQRIWHINIPGIMPTIMILLILSMPAILSAGYDQIYPLVNPTNMEVSNVLDVYIVNLGLSRGQYSVTTAIGLVLSIINLGMVLGVNYIAKKLNQETLL